MKKTLQSLFLLLAALMLPATATATDYVRGDVNGDGEVNIADINAVIAVILGGASNPAADVNSDGEVNIADINAVIDIILHPVVIEEHEYVNLGLPSGTLWATCNIGASSPEEYGDYFAWGETEPKEDYNYRTYKWYGSYSTYTKYVTNSNYGYNGFVDNKTELDPEDDAAYVNWGENWRMPTKEQKDELNNNCTRTWSIQNGVNGMLVTGPNGNTLFLPAAGYRFGISLGYAESRGYYWTRTLFSSNVPYYVFFTQDLPTLPTDDVFRFRGCTVRPVRVSQN